MYSFQLLHMMLLALHAVQFTV